MNYKTLVSKPINLCHARKCTTRVAPPLLMCSAHWHQVPLALQRHVWKTMRGRRNVTPAQSPERWIAFFTACAAAVAAVAEAEGLSPRNDYQKALPQLLALLKEENNEQTI